jgi:transcription elongation GreA/GreB family factor
MIVTKHSLTARKEYHKSVEARIKVLQAEKEEARAQGDLSENAGYVEAIRGIENYRRILADRPLEHTQIMDPMEWVESETSNACLGTKISLKINNVTSQFLIGGAWDTELENPDVIAYTSPLARAVIGKEVGHQGKLPNGTLVELVKIEAPTIKFLEKIYGTPEKSKTKKEDCPQMQM